MALRCKSHENHYFLLLYYMLLWSSQLVLWKSLNFYDYDILIFQRLKLKRTDV